MAPNVMLATAGAPAPAVDSVEPTIRLRGVAKRFRSRGQVVAAVEEFSLDASPGEFVAIVGPSGCGKSTVLNMVAGLITPSEGAIMVGGAPVKGVNPHVGYVTQQDNLLPWRTLRENVELPYELAVRRAAPSDRRARADTLIRRVGLAGFENHYPHELSGGMRQRVNICRTLVYSPDVILMDEPFGPLDAMTRGVLQQELLNLWAELRKTVLFVTHDLHEAIVLADRVVVMSARPGRIKGIEPVRIARPRSLAEVQNHPEFARVHAVLHRLIWDELSSQVAGHG